MPSRFTHAQLVDKALLALEEACAQSGTRAAEPTRALRFALAYLGNDVADRSAFDAFWKAVAGAGDKGINPTLVHMLRRSAATGALVAIRRFHGREPPT